MLTDDEVSFGVNQNSESAVCGVVCLCAKEAKRDGMKRGVMMQSGWPGRRDLSARARRVMACRDRIASLPDRTSR